MASTPSTTELQQHRRSAVGASVSDEAVGGRSSALIEDHDELLGAIGGVTPASESRPHPARERTTAAIHPLIGASPEDLTYSITASRSRVERDGNQALSSSSETSRGAPQHSGAEQPRSGT